MQLSELSLFQTFRRSLQLVIQSATTELRTLIFLTLISGSSPAISLFLNKIIIDQISHLLGKYTTVSSLILILQEPILLGSIGGLILLNLLTESMNAIASLVFSSLRDRVQGFAQSIVLNKVANFADIALFETPELLNLVQLAETGIERLKELSLLVITTLHGFFILIPAILLSGSITWWIPLILFTSATPAIYVELTYRKKSWEVEETQASLVRQMNLHRDVLVGEAYAKELRLFQLQPLLLDRWQNLFQTMFRSMQQIRKKGMVLVITWSMVNGLGTALPYIYVVIGALRGIYTLGDLALYAGLILQVRQSLFLLINNGSNLYDVVLGTRPILQLLELKPKLRLSLASREDTAAKLSLTPRVIAQHQGIQIKNLSFSYPGSDSKILDNINLTIQPHQTIALVGENGAGKTTLAKLLCRLYDPGSGEILWNGQDLREIDLVQLYSRLAVVMQDYARFPATVCENVGFGYLSALQDVNAIKEALRAAGIAKVVDNLPQGLETLLGKQLADGVDLSGGQWQRIAIARALMRLSSAELLILDEPTSALDPKTEHEIYQLLRTIAANKMAVFISHRLALSKLADQIIVLENGKIIETGSHEELIVRGGQYHLMFSRQASSYQ
ncbi:ABC transporter ATP-binding protein [Nostoc sp. ATCC 53789]|uniref:ABC transporter ATP-binding protein n=1 Tax=Nostoc sp. ATCC 53789 TaxID=76335 RepID=UPI000DEC4F4F|nr:ABC transporter ATP-binding protein [Nostoc sp. ATCC 53789]QHG14902.1 ATP-binding cassette domain-containing protein [Nostoc sp. ATCC 53789]RCJ20380.1 ABC transporter [Nostoc sp. ATCC 53789]